MHIRQNCDHEYIKQKAGKEEEKNKNTTMHCFHALVLVSVQAPVFHTPTL